MVKKATTLFIEDTSIRVLESRGRQVERWLSAPLDPGLVTHGLIVDPERVALKLKEAFSLGGINSKKVAVGLSDPGSLYRLISLPKLPDAILPEAVKREAERVIPVSLDEVYLSYQVIPTEGNDTRVFMAAFSKNSVDSLIKTLQSCGLKPSVMDLVPLTLCRAIGKPTAVMVSLRSSNFDIAILIDRIPHVIRSLSLSGEAETLVDKLATVTEELERTISFYNSSHTDSPLDSSVPIFISGDLSQRPENWSPVSGKAELTGKALAGQAAFPDGFDPDQYIVNLGLALKEPRRSGSQSSLVDFNALPERFLPEKPNLGRIAAPVGVIVGVVVLGMVGLRLKNAGAVTAEMQSQLTFQQTRTTQLTKEIALVREQIKLEEAQITPLETQIKKAESNAAAMDAVLANLTGNRQTTYNDLKQAVDLIPDGVTVTNVSYSDAIGLTGTALDENAVFKYARDLRETSNFPGTSIRSITQSGESEFFNFELSLR